MEHVQSSYRPHNPGHDYYDAGIYLITLVVTEREPILSKLNMDEKAPGVTMSDLGEYVCKQWIKTEELQARLGNKIKVLAQISMPDHWHAVIEVQERMTWSLGAIIQAVKSACTSYYRKTIGYTEPPLTAKMIRHMSHEGRLKYFASRPRCERPLFDADYDDTICLNERHRQAMLAYVADNPRRAILRITRPDFTRRYLHLRISSTDKNGIPVTREYAAFGNLFLLRWARKVRVFCHRKLPRTNIPYTSTTQYQSEHDEWIKMAMEGATVIVTPGISEGERLMKNECLAKGIPLIHIQKEPISNYWKPEKARFEACANGTLLILSPYDSANLGDVNGVPSNTIYSAFHNLNDIAAEICQFDGKAWIVQ